MDNNNLDTIEVQRAKKQIEDLFGAKIEPQQEEETDEIRRAKISTEYAFKSAEVGFKKFQDLASIFDPSSSEERKQAVIDTMKERDSFYAENKDDLNFSDKITGSIVETISNPAELGAQLGLAIGTGGSSIPVQLGAQLGFDLAQANLESYRYQDRLLTPKENAIVGAASVAPDLLVIGGGALIRKGKSAILGQSSVLGDETINVRKTIDVYDNAGFDNMSKQQQIKTDFPNSIDGDPYNVNFGSAFKKPKDIYFDTIKEFGDDDINSTFQLNELFRKEFGKEYSGDTFLQRIWNDYDMSSERAFEWIPEQFPSEINTKLDEIYGRGFSKKTDFQKMIVVQNKENDMIDRFAKDIKPTVDDYYNRWKKANDPNSDKNVEVYLNTEQIDNALNNIDFKFNTQKLYVQNEYLNIINKGYDNTPIDLKTFISNSGTNDTTIAKAWIYGKDDTVNGISSLSSINRNNFFEKVYDDSVLLDELNMKTSLFDIDEFDSFNRKFGTSFDADGDIIYDGNLFKNLSKATDDEKEVLLSAMRDNEEQYIDFIVNAKEVSDNIGEPSEFLKTYADFFGTNTRSMKSFIKKNKDLIDVEYKKITDNIPFDKSNPKIWKKNVAKAIAKNKKALAEESIKINQTINKQKLLGYIQQYYDGSVDRNTLNKINIKDNMIEAFNNDIKPFYDNGVFKLEDGEDMTTHFARFVAELKKTRASAKVLGEYKSIGELREFFNDGRMPEFFINVNDGKFLKTNAEMIRDIFDFNTSAIARFSEYGSTSPFVPLNKFKYKLKESFSKLDGKELSMAKNNVLSAAQERAENMFRATQIGTGKKPSDSWTLLSKTARSGLRRGILAFSGLPELFGQNYFIALSRAQKYGGFRAYSNQLRFIVKRIKSDAPNAKYSVAQLMKDLDSNSFSIQKDAWSKYDYLAFSFQQSSDKQLRRIGESMSVATLHNLPKKFDTLENELKDLLRMKGITADTYDSFRKFAIDHIDNNGLIVNIDKLSKQIEYGSDINAKALRDIHYHLTDYIGNISHKSKFYERKYSEMEQWYNMFRAFSRSMNADTFNRMTQYIDANGVAKNRFGKTIINKDYIDDFGVKGMSKDVGYLATATTALVVGGYGLSVAKEMLESDRTLKQKIAVIKTNRDKIAQLATDRDVMEAIVKVMDITGTNPTDIMSATDLPSSVLGKIRKTYNTFTDEEKKTLGTNMEDGVQVLFEETFKTIARVPRNVLTAMYKETQGDIETMPDRIYGFNKEDMAIFESYVRNSIDIESDSEMKATQSNIDYMENNTESYDKLSDTTKNVAQVIWSNGEIQDLDDFKSHVAKASYETKTKEELVEKIANERPSDKIDVQSTIDILNNQPKSEFEKLGEKKMDYFYMVMKFKGIDKPSQKDYDMFIKNFKNIKRTNLSKVLKDVYGIDKREFDMLYQNEDLRVKAINYYK